jgi:hypothetical protein
LLTDGFASDKQDLLKLIKEKCDKDTKTKVFSFGISDNCDKELVEKSAEHGRGAHTLIGNDDMALIKEAVMTSLRRAGVPAMQECSFDFGNGQEQGIRNEEIYLGHMRQLGTLYSTEIVRIFSLMTEEEFDKMNCVFHSKFNPVTKEPST